MRSASRAAQRGVVPRADRRQTAVLVTSHIARPMTRHAV